jgi:hydroxypyruvate reductase
MTGQATPPSDLAGLRAGALRLFRAGVEAADPEKAVARSLQVTDASLSIRLDSGGWRTGRWRQVRVASFGKAACTMARAAARILPREILHVPGVAVTNYENVADVPHFDVVGAGHPLPDSNGVIGAKAVSRLIGDARPGELALVLISGGGSALLPYPSEGIPLADKVAATNLLLASGADIGEMNTVRKHLSRLKGGGLARLAARADLHALILSDVLGDDLSTIASGPTVPDPTTFADAKEAMERHGVWQKVPSTVREHIERGVSGQLEETPKPGDPVFERAGSTLIGSNAVSLQAMRKAAADAGFRVVIHDECLRGEAREAAEGFVRAGLAAASAPGGSRPVAVLAGGETTVTLRGKGRGGRNQEMALAFALAAERLKLSGDWVFLSGGTDGRDGPTDAAGGVVDPRTLTRIRDAGADPAALLEDNDSYRALTAAGDLLRTGATGTNVADLQVLLIA